MISIKKARISDSKQIVELEKEVRDDIFVCNIYDNAAFIEYGFVFVAKDKEKLVGAIVSFLGKNDIIFVTDFVVHPKYRNQGIGIKLYKKLIKETKKIIHALVGPKYKQSIYLHEKLGFERAKKVCPYGSAKDVMYLYILNQGLVSN